jgi:hypothetical protein
MNAVFGHYWNGNERGKTEGLGDKPEYWSMDEMSLRGKPIDSEINPSIGAWMKCH